MTTLSDRLKALRAERGWSQPELARRSGVKQSFIGALEAKNQKSSGWLPELAHALGVDAYWLKTGKGDPKRTFLGDYQPQANATRFQANEPPTRVYQLPTASPLVHELVEIAERMNEAGLNRLIGQAQQLVEIHPKIDVKNAAK